MQADLSHDPQSSNRQRAPSAANPSSQGNNASSSDQRKPAKHVSKSNQVCRYYGTKKGCRAQDQCLYLHIQSTGTSAKDNSAIASNHGPIPGAEQANTPETIKPNTKPPQVNQRPKDRTAVAKPTSSLQQKDPREFQIGQVVRRFSPLREDGPTGTILRLKLPPSDPDFPFELQALECTLTVPIAYPKDGRPCIKVENKEIPLGFQINVERGFDSLCNGPTPKTLLQLLNELDRQLERFLTSEKAQTIKIVANRRKEDGPSTMAGVDNVKPESISNISATRSAKIPSWSKEQAASAKAKRDIDIRQLEARMGRIPLFSSSKDGVSFNIPLQIPKPSRLPLSLQSLKEATLVVPTLYDLEPCRIKLKGVAGIEAENVEFAFERRAIDQRKLTLMGHINNLTQNIHTMAISSITPTQPTAEVLHPAIEVGASSTAPAVDVSEKMEDVIIDEDRPHLRFLSQPPPEWSRQRADNDEISDSESTEEYDSSEDYSDLSDGAQSQVGGASVPASAPSTALEKGILLSFPHLELHGIELLQLRDISLSVKCDRCKDNMDVKNIKAAEPTSTSIRTESCNKCASPMSMSYRPEAMHMNSIRAGYLDLEGCTVVDMLPSHFLPTCSECSTTQPLPGIISVRGESPISVCRECHHRLNFKIPEVKFLRVSSNDPRLHLPLRSKRKKENLGITAGTELPDRGRCKHYSKSYRWFRFSCCNRVYPCDRCHDEKEEHPNEHANRMICGWCSREQNYRPEDCGSCGRSVIRRTGGGFWEGGKGTRDKVKMSRKDPRKFKRIGGGARGGEK